MEKPMYLITKTGALIGVCSHAIDGWRFLPQTVSHGPSRKAWSTPVKCIPEWAFDMSDDLLTIEEWKARNAQAMGGYLACEVDHAPNQ